MNSLAKILLPVDFSERSSLALHYIRELALPMGSELILAHVLAPLHSEHEAPPQAAGSMLVDIYRMRSEQAERDLAAFELKTLEGLRVRRTVLHGLAPEMISLAPGSVRHTSGITSRTRYTTLSTLGG